MSQIEFVIGKEWHSSNWGKYYMKGLEDWQVREDSEYNEKNTHHFYQYYICLDIPDETVFSIFEQSGNKRGTQEFRFALCVINPNKHTKDKAVYGSGYCQGNYEIIVKTDSIIKSSRLLEWWNSNSEKSLKFAQHCTKYIQKKGIKNLPPLE